LVIRIAGSYQAESDEFLTAISIGSTPSFGGEAKPSASGKVLSHVNEPYEYERDT
jgi:hypothetical protein